jgi:hypothetical protein
MRVILKTTAALVTSFVALWLLNDAMTFALYAPSPERQMGCYTAVELWLAVTEPHDSIRQTELFSGLSLLAAVIIAAMMTAIRRRRRGKLTAAL